MKVRASKRFLRLLGEVSAKLRTGVVATPFLAETGQPRMRPTEVRPICNRRAISALLTPA